MHSTTANRIYKFKLHDDHSTFAQTLHDAHMEKYQNHWFAETSADNRKFGTNYTK
jgi:hypothetical protein